MTIIGWPLILEADVADELPNAPTKSTVASTVTNIVVGTSTSTGATLLHLQQRIPLRLRSNIGIGSGANMSRVVYHVTHSTYTPYTAAHTAVAVAL